MLKVKLAHFIWCSKIWDQITLIRISDFKILLEVKGEAEKHQKQGGIWTQRNPCLFRWNSSFSTHYGKSQRLTVNFRHPTALLNTLKYFTKFPKASEKRYWEITKKVKSEKRNERREKKKKDSSRRADIRVENRWGALTIIKRERSCLVRALFSCEWAEKRESLSSSFLHLFRLLLRYKSMFWLLRLLT